MKIVDKGTVEVGGNIEFPFFSNTAAGVLTDGDSAPVVTSVFMSQGGGGYNQLVAADVTALALVIDNQQDTAPASVVGAFQVRSGALPATYVDETKFQINVTHTIGGVDVVVGFTLRVNEEDAVDPQLIGAETGTFELGSNVVVQLTYVGPDGVLPVVNSGNVVINNMTVIRGVGLPIEMDTTAGVTIVLPGGNGRLQFILQVALLEDSTNTLFPLQDGDKLGVEFVGTVPGNKEAYLTAVYDINDSTPSAGSPFIS